tara:strand:+ start:1749 stop:2141 length:393 start_codon:yes stop_codon:yes gene_type:complete
MTTAIPTIAVFPEEKLTLDQKIEKWVWQLCRTLEENYQQSYPNSSSDKTFKMEFGRKYIKIVGTDIDSNGKEWSQGVHAFIDKKTGEVYKPASWKSPAKIVRYDLRIISDRQRLHNPNFTDWAGGYLYLR